jgi:hypothetical protein
MLQKVGAGQDPRDEIEIEIEIRGSEVGWKSLYSKQLIELYLSPYITE